MINDCNENGDDDDMSEKSKWVIRIKMNRELLLDKNITMDDIHFALKNAYDDEINCIYSDYNSDDLILSVNEDGTYELGSTDFSKRYNMKELMLIEKFDLNKIYSVIYKNGSSRDYYIKRFKIETSIIDRKFSLTQDISHSKIVAATSKVEHLLKFNYIAKKGDKKTKEIDIDNFVAVKNWKAIGNKIIGYNRLSSFKIEKAKMDSSDNNNDSENLELTLF